MLSQVIRDETARPHPPAVERYGARANGCAGRWLPTRRGPEVHLREFDRLRAEIDNRSLLQHGIIAAELAAIAASFGVFDKSPEVLIGVARLTTYLWLLWMDHALGIDFAATYIRNVLAV